mmetsp:Transcript_17728/g.25014  ORF Transcript_17728/g.25014 Transcript_17728/m.25014 type:complete len:298 (-) Transcript_17728:97-990(-)
MNTLKEKMREGSGKIKNKILRKKSPENAPTSATATGRYMPPNVSSNHNGPKSISDESQISLQLRNSMNEKIEMNTAGNPNFRMLAFAGGVAMVVTAIISMAIYFYHFDLFRIIIAIYAIIFGSLICILEGKFLPQYRIVLAVRNFATKFLPILRFLWGRGALYMFSGSLQAALMTPMNIFSGVFLIGVGLVFVGVGVDTNRKMSKLKNSIRNERVLRREFNRYDVDKNGHLDQTEFAQLMMNLTSGAIDTDELDAAFDLIDLDDSGSISYEELKTWWETFDSVTEDEETKHDVNPIS